MLFEKKHFGKPISEELSLFLRNYTDKFDRADVSAETEIGTSTLRDVTFRANSITESNSKGIIELVRIAAKNCYLRISKSKEDTKLVKRLLGKDEVEKIVQEIKG